MSSNLDILLFKFHDGSITEEEMNDFIDALRTSQGRMHLVNESYLTSALVDFYRVQAATPAKLQPEPSKRLETSSTSISRAMPTVSPSYSSVRIFTWAALAACLMLAFFIPDVLNRLQPSGIQMGIAKQSAGEVQLERKGLKLKLSTGDVLKSGDKIVTEAGEYFTAKLDDGSLLELGPNTKLEFQSFSGKKRIKIHQGRLTAHVAKQKEEPILFRSEIAEVKVLGTQFHIRAAKDRFELDLTEGKVSVSNRENGHQAMLTAGQHVSLLEGESMKLNVFDSSRYDLTKARGKVSSLSPTNQYFELSLKSGEKQTFFMPNSPFESSRLPKSLELGLDVEISYFPGSVNRFDSLKIVEK